ncbi:unnamed protein product [Penicillium olsonii]|uniref:Lipase B n=1 Tax=Penicillium olsonii TaxID=99116 RepID=A0A9W4HKK4_PENOL|nr:unnamed protein product [Penicillium olsonii]
MRLLYFLLSTAMCNPLFRREALDIPEILEVLDSSLYTNKDTAQQVFQLSSLISDITSGKINPVQSINEGLTLLSKIPNTTSLERAIAIVSAGLVPSNITTIFNPNPINSYNNTNPPPKTPIYPKSTTDAPYDIPEPNLRSAIYIPPTFTCTKIPILLVPGTADPAGLTFSFSYSRLLETNTTNPVWVNIPDNSLSDIQDNAQYIAYAINYLSTQCGRSIGVLGWSQGALDIQWVLKYWPSTRSVVSDFLAVSADFHGTRVQSLCVLDEALCTPAIRQQGYESGFVRALRDGGDSAFVPTTSIYSDVDFVVQPQSGEGASGLLGDARGVGVSNTQVQVVCAGEAGGGFYSHSGMLVHPLAYALFLDALGHEGPGRVERIDLGVCRDSLAPGLGLGDFLGMEAVSDVLGPIEVLLYGESSGREPVLKDYVHEWLEIEIQGEKVL